MWYDYFLGAIAIIAIIRLVLVMTGSSQPEERVSKAMNWIIGLLLVTISWGIISYVFNKNMGGNFQIGGKDGIISEQQSSVQQPLADENAEQITIKVGDEQE